MDHLTQFGTLTEAARKKAIHALERRFGPSMMPYQFRRSATNKRTWIVRDTESGSQIEFQFRNGRMAVLAEIDGACPTPCEAA